MAIDIKAPLVEQLFAIGQSVGANGNNAVTGQAQTGGFQNRAPAPAPQTESGGNGSGALATAAGHLAGQYLGSKVPDTQVDAKGNGFGLGGKLVDGQMGGASYAGDSAQNRLMSFFNKKEAPSYMPKDNGTTPHTNPFALNYANAPQAPGLLLQY